MTSARFRALQRYAYTNPMTRARALETGHYAILGNGVIVAVSVNK